MRGGPKTLTEIRSAACNSILVTITVLAIPAAGASLLRILEQGWKPVMALLLRENRQSCGNHGLGGRADGGRRIRRPKRTVD